MHIHTEREIEIEIERERESERESERERYIEKPDFGPILARKPQNKIFHKKNQFGQL